MSIDPIAAEAKAVREGAHAFLQSDGSFFVRSASRAGVRHRVTLDVVFKGGRWLARLRCTCESGSARMSAPVPCWHAALVGRRYEREGYARWDDGAWWLTPEGYERLGAGPPKVRKMRGPCPVCKHYQSIRTFDTDTRRPEAVASEHNERCRKEYIKREQKLASQPPLDIDLWDRPGPR